MNAMQVTTLRRIFEKIVANCKINAVFLSIILIALIECTLQSYLPDSFASHEVDWTLRSLEQPQENGKVVLLGDSVGRGIFDDWSLKNGNLVSLACNQATEVAGQYFFLKRFLEKNMAPGAVIICDRTPFRGNLNQNLTENYVQRCFTHWSEIFDLMIVKFDPVFTAKMVAYKLFATFKYRLHLQKKILGFTNSDIYSGINQSNNLVHSNLGLVSIIAKLNEKSRRETIAQFFFKKILTTLDQIDVPLYYLPPPSRIDNEDNHRRVSSSIVQAQSLKERFSNFHVMSAEYSILPGEYFRDEVHLNHEGVGFYRSQIQLSIEAIMLEAQQRQDKMLSHLFATGKEIPGMENNFGLSKFLPLSDVIVKKSESTLVVESIGNDPALLLPLVPKIIKNREDRLMVKVVVDSTVDATTKLYFSQKNDTLFSEHDTVPASITTGKNALFFILPKKYSGGSLRFDPSECPGIFELTNIEMRVVEGKLIDSITMDKD